MYAPTHAEIGDIWLDVSVHESHDAEAEVSEHPVELGTAIADHIRPLPRTIEIEGLVTNHPIEMPMSHTGSAVVARGTQELVVAARSLPRISPRSGTIEGEPGVGLIGALPGVDQGVALLGALRLDPRSKRRYAAEQYHVNERATESIGVAALTFSEPFDRVQQVHAELLRIMDESLLVTVITGLTVYENVALTRLHIERAAGNGPSKLQFTATGRVLRIVSSEVVALPKVKTKSRGKQAAPVVPAAGLIPLPVPVNNDALDFGSLWSDPDEDHSEGP